MIKYATRDYSPSSTGGRAATRSLMTGEYARAADEWPASDLRLPRKQRHTARRVHERLVAELGFPGEYSSVQRWVKQWREAHRRESDGFAELEWAPGVAQVDSAPGQGRGRWHGTDGAFLAVSFPYSNMRYVAALPGDTTGVRVPRTVDGVRAYGHGDPGAGVRTTPRVSDAAAQTVRSR